MEVKNEEIIHYTPRIIGLRLISNTRLFDPGGEIRRILSNEN